MFSSVLFGVFKLSFLSFWRKWRTKTFAPYLAKPSLFFFFHISIPRALPWARLVLVFLSNESTVKVTIIHKFVLSFCSVRIYLGSPWDQWTFSFSSSVRFLLPRHASNHSTTQTHITHHVPHSALTTADARNISCTNSPRQLTATFFNPGKTPIRFLRTPLMRMYWL